MDVVNFFQVEFTRYTHVPLTSGILVLFLYFSGFLFVSLYQLLLDCFASLVHREKKAMGRVTINVLFFFPVISFLPPCRYKCKAESL